MKFRLIKEYDPVQNSETWHVEARSFIFWYRISARHPSEKRIRDLFERLQRQGYYVKTTVVEHS